jgi:hypothetical protein
MTEVIFSLVCFVTVELLVVLNVQFDEQSR